jgi:hypothetical protein
MHGQQNTKLRKGRVMNLLPICAFMTGYKENFTLKNK